MPSEPTRQDRKAEKGRVKAQRRNRRKLSKQRGMSKMRRDPKGKRKMGKKR
jgi:hypothetical protein